MDPWLLLKDTISAILMFLTSTAITKNGTPGDFICSRNSELVQCYFQQNRLESITYVTTKSLLLLILLRLAALTVLIPRLRRF